MNRTDDRVRLDIFLVENGYTDSREKAKHVIRAGDVLVGDKVVLKSSRMVNSDSNVKIVEGFGYVGRGGYKIDNATKHFGIDFTDKVIADIGCSVGGFTDYVLKHGAKKVYAVDTGDVLDKSLRGDARIIYMPNTDARRIGKFYDRVDLCLIDVTFSTIESILSVAGDWLVKNGEVLGLIKPPFEIGEKVKKIRSYEECAEMANRSVRWAESNGYTVKGLINSDLKGKTANQQEFFIYLTSLY